MTKFPKSLTVVATAAALVAGVAFAQTATDPAQQPAPNTTGLPGATLGAQDAGSVNSGSTMNNSGSTMGSSVDSGTTNAQSDIVSPEPRADRN